MQLKKKNSIFIKLFVFLKEWSEIIINFSFFFRWINILILLLFRWLFRWYWFISIFFISIVFKFNIFTVFTIFFFTSLNWSFRLRFQQNTTSITIILSFFLCIYRSFHFFRFIFLSLYPWRLIIIALFCIYSNRQIFFLFCLRRWWLTLRVTALIISFISVFSLICIYSFCFLIAH